MSIQSRPVRFKIWEGRNGESTHYEVPTFGVIMGSNRYKEQIWYSSLVRSRNEPPAMTVERSRNEPAAVVRNHNYLGLA